ncbi:hypothetical protein CDD81_6599 [Ophiocordyceps australis]|uniref:Uncharacterized protein n=1 Tax=Ophiocordyceps australis TaxID=1399860 RepID=A0A2C5Y7N8_9HYPO|nr:hypothetical protein CDD81_6599 [Ophiocordyceps australis]
MMVPSTPSPKRKRGQDVPVTPLKFSFELGHIDRAANECSDSPRTCVTHKFRGLALAGDHDNDDEGDGSYDVDALGVKRQKSDQAMPDAPALADMSATSSIRCARDSEPQQACGETETTRTKEPEPQAGQAAQMEPTSTVVRNLWEKTPALPIIGNQSKPPQRRRSGTPPLKMKTSPTHDRTMQDDVTPVVDPVRAALTWHEDEITIYDPTDADDDGTGINGIGFKPTPALAQARVLKRRQQLAEYRRREESEARARRSERRRNGTPTPSARITKRKSPTRRVRFVDAESHKIAVTIV